MAKLTDTQTILLSTAAQRESGSLYPLPSTLRPSGGTAKSIAALVKVGVAEEREVSEPAQVHRTEGGRIKVRLSTAAIESRIGVELVAGVGSTIKLTLDVRLTRSGLAM